jgi:hypothetical protein
MTNDQRVAKDEGSAGGDDSRTTIAPTVCFAQREGRFVLRHQDIPSAYVIKHPSYFPIVIRH